MIQGWSRWRSKHHVLQSYGYIAGAITNGRCPIWASGFGADPLQIRVLRTRVEVLVLRII